MKKSEAYHLAQIAVVNSPCAAPERKLQILRILMDQEYLAKLCEKQEESEGQENGKSV